MFTFKLVVDRASASDAWPGDSIQAVIDFQLNFGTRLDAFANSPALEGLEDIVLQNNVSENGLQRVLTIAFPTEQSRADWKASEEAVTGWSEVATAMSSHCWYGWAEDYPG